MRKASKVLMTFDSDSTTMMWLLLTIRLRLVLERKKTWRNICFAAENDVTLPTVSRC